MEKEADLGQVPAVLDLIVLLLAVGAGGIGSLPDRLAHPAAVSDRRDRGGRGPGTGVGAGYTARTPFKGIGMRPIPVSVGLKIVGT